MKFLMDMKVKKGVVLGLMERLDEYCSKHNLWLVEKISKGFSSEVFLAENEKGKQFALKIEKDKSRRVDMAEKEARFLALANTVSVGPRFFGFDKKNRVLSLKFIDGKTFNNWLFEENPPKKVLEKFVKELLRQAEKLDKIGLSHGQLAGKGKNILVRKNLPVIIDFEKASVLRPARNANQVRGLLFENPNSAIAKKVKGII